MGRRGVVLVSEDVLKAKDFTIESSDKESKIRKSSREFLVLVAVFAISKSEYIYIYIYIYIYTYITVYAHDITRTAQ